MTPISPEEAGLWSRFVFERSGIYLDQSKNYLLTSRLQDLLKETKSAGFAELYYKVRESSSLQTKVVDAITTNETSFFRDSAPFELVRHKLIPELIDRRSKANGRLVPIRIWSAGCSTGQEVYTIAIVLREMLSSINRFDIHILGTDISNRALAAASRGCFNELEIQRGMPVDLHAKYFSRQNGEHKVVDDLRAMASFRNMNLLQPFSFPAPFDIVFCRNVAIYFTPEHRQQLFRNIGKWLAPGGALVIGSTESLSGLCPEFHSHRHLRSVYYSLS